MHNFQKLHSSMRDAIKMNDIHPCLNYHNSKFSLILLSIGTFIFFPIMTFIKQIKMKETIFSYTNKTLLYAQKWRCTWNWTWRSIWHHHITAQSVHWQLRNEGVNLTYEKWSEAKREYKMEKRKDYRRKIYRSWGFPVSMLERSLYLIIFARAGLLPLWCAWQMMSNQFILCRSILILFILTYYLGCLT